LAGRRRQQSTGKAVTPRPTLALLEQPERVPHSTQDGLGPRSVVAARFEVCNQLALSSNSRFDNKQSVIAVGHYMPDQ
jgi:hypothetical protein